MVATPQEGEPAFFELTDEEMAQVHGGCLIAESPLSFFGLTLPFGFSRPCGCALPGHGQVHCM
jgi:hypothetical protein